MSSRVCRCGEKLVKAKKLEKADAVKAGLLFFVYLSTILTGENYHNNPVDRECSAVII